MTRVKQIGHAELLRLISEGALVVDALPPAEYEAQHLPGAVNLPLQEASDNAIADWDRDLPVVTYCADNQCDLSPRLAAWLATRGFTRVYDYATSIADWTGRGLPIEGENADVATAGARAREDMPTCGPEETVAMAASYFGEHVVLGVVDDDGVLVGRLWRKDVEVLVEEGCGDERAADAMHPGPSTFRPDVPVTEMADWFAKRDVEAFIITSLDGRPLGALYREDVERVTAEATDRHMAEAHGH